MDIINISNIIPIKKFSSLQRLLVVTCYVNRFINNIQKSKKKLAGTISFEEKDNALNVWIRSEQKYVIFSEKFKGGWRGWGGVGGYERMVKVVKTSLHKNRNYNMTNLKQY